VGDTASWVAIGEAIGVVLALPLPLRLALEPRGRPLELPRPCVAVVCERGGSRNGFSDGIWVGVGSGGLGGAGAAVWAGTSDASPIGCVHTKDCWFLMEGSISWLAKGSDCHSSWLLFILSIYKVLKASISDV